MGDYTEDEARWALFQSNNMVDVATEILLSCPPVSSARIRLDESQYRPPVHEVEGVTVIHLSLLGPRSLSFLFLFNNRFLKANPTVRGIQLCSKQSFQPHHPGVSETPPSRFFFIQIHWKNAKFQCKKKGLFTHIVT